MATTRSGRRRPRLRRAGAALALTSALLASACAGTGTRNSATIRDSETAAGSAGLHGTLPTERLDKPTLNTLTDVTGAPFDLRARTQGRITLLFFGYTHCPDVCPTTMADLTAALREVPADVRRQVAVVFVTTDPDRDSGPVLARWLGQFDSTFIGARGPFGQVQADASALGVALSRPQVQADGSVLVAHGSQVTVFARDDRARILYRAGTSIQDYINDLPRLTAERSGPRPPT